jgi:hypothetical protein
MRINELLEGTNFKDIDFVKHSGESREINFDLPDDLMHFMNSDDSVYRRHLHPVITKCINSIKIKKPTNPSIFKPAVQDSYKLYIRKFPIKELPLDIDEKMCEETCKKMHDETIKHIKDGKYKD